MNYRNIISELFVDYCERKSAETNPAKREAYSEIIKDIRFCLDLEVQEIANNNALKNLLK